MKKMFMDETEQNEICSYVLKEKKIDKTPLKTFSSYYFLPCHMYLCQRT